MNRIQHFFFILTITCFILSSFTTKALAQPACLGEQGKLKWLLWENVTNNRLDYMTHLHNFPNQPDAYENISSIKSPGIVSETTVDGNIYYSVNYGSYYGSLIRGYITVPQTGNYSFNITGDDECQFYLSTNDTKGNLVLNASVTEWTYRSEYAKATEVNQTSPNISLQAGQYYYFEVLQKENSGGDHVEVKWKTPLDPNNWQDITGTNIYGYDNSCANNCPKSGTACDDGNANTIDDKEDGFCHCVGTPTTVPECVGKQGEVRALYYLGIDGNSMSSFLEADKYPLMPDTVEMLDFLKGPIIRRDTYGTRISGMLKVPVTGDYQFNVTCDDRASFKLSTTESPDDAVEISYSNWSPEFNHYYHSYQLNPPVTLNKDNFYYFEMNYREGTGTDRFSAFWRTPFMGDTLWRVIDKAYIYGYNCELACVPEGTPCDDGNKFTKNDQYDANCDCIGIPCQGAECEESLPLNYTPIEKCGVSELVDNSPADAWESCTPSPNPNTGRGVSHWIQYDFGQVYLLNETHIWNYNASGSVGKGFKDVVIDYSSDGVNWTQFGGIVEWAQASGTVGYEGFEGPNFNGITARYVLITALNSWENGACSGFNKITFAATDCLLMGQSCDDGDPNSVNDKYDANCICIGEGAGFTQNPCAIEELIQNNVILSSKDYRASARIISEAIIKTGNNVQLMAGESVQLLPGFSAEVGSNFIAMIADCNSSLTQESPLENGLSKIDTKEDRLSIEKAQAIDSNPNLGVIEVENTSLQVWPNPTNSWTSFTFNLPYSTLASLSIYTTDGKLISSLSNNQNFAAGSYAKEFPAQQLAAGMYYVVLKTEKEVLNKPMVVIK